MVVDPPLKKPSDRDSGTLDFGKKSLSRFDAITTFEQKKPDFNPERWILKRGISLGDEG